MRKVTEVKFHQVIFVRGIGQLDTTVSTTSKGTKSVDVDMKTDGVNLYMELGFRNERAEVLVPLANCVMCVLAPEDKPPAGASER